MANYVEPTKKDFNSAEQVAIDVLSTACPTLLTKTGSVVRELLIRPMAYLMSWLTRNTANDLKQYSVAYLKTSQLTENEIADAVASNYFVSRKDGTASQGIITLTLTRPTLRLPQGSRFIVGDVPVHTTSQYLISNADGTDSDELVFLKSVQVGDKWAANVPVEAVSVGAIEVPVGADVSVGFSCNILEAAELTSPMTGGTSVETDAEMMIRAEYNTAESGIGSYYGLKKKLSKAPVKVFDIMTVAGEDDPLYRARRNAVGINPGGYIDCYVKTANQIITALIPEVTLTKVSNAYEGYVDLPQYAGIIGVNGVFYNGASCGYTVTFEGSSSSADGDRLSSRQKTKITCSINSSASTVVVACNISYMPSVNALQQFMDKDENHFIGQDVLVKAALPVQVAFDFAVHSDIELSDDDLDTLKQAVTNYVNNTPVGSKLLNFSDVRNACISVLPTVEPRLPCVMTATVPLRDGSMTSFYSNTGILEIDDPADNYAWNYKPCFFSTCKDLVRVSVV